MSTSSQQPAIRIHPDDAHNRALVEQTHPGTWVNPQPSGRYNLVVIGAGTAGLTAAAGCAAIGGRVALIERHLTGGDCLITGCVPSKGIISASRVAATMRYASAYGIQPVRDAGVDFPAVMERMRRLRAKISPNDSVHHLKKAGVDVFLGAARFASSETIEVDGKALRFARAVIATGARAAVPPIAGLKEAGYLTNENLFELTSLPKRFVMIGAGPIGCEMAQAFQRLGSAVTLIDAAAHILIREDQDAAEIIQQKIQSEGVKLLLGAKVLSVRRAQGETMVSVEQNGSTTDVRCDALLVGVGRSPNTEGLNLEAAGVVYDKNGVRVNDHLQTSNPRIFAAGDVCTAFKFTHTANVLGRMAMVSALFGKPIGGKMNRLIIPWCTYTDPEVAHVGLYEAQAREAGYAVTTLTVPLADNDRALLDGEENGFIRVHLKRGTDRILGATVVAAHAGDLLNYFTLAMTSAKGLSFLANAIYPYPTQAEAIKKIANLYLQTKLSPAIKTAMRTWLAWRR